MQATDPSTGSIAQSSAGFSGTLNAARTSLTVSTTVAASARGTFKADAYGASGTTIQLPAFSQPTPATLEINLLGDYGTNPSSAFSVQTQAQGIISSSHSPQVDITSLVSSNIQGAATFFGFDVRNEMYAPLPFGVESQGLGIAPQSLRPILLLVPTERFH